MSAGVEVILHQVEVEPPAGGSTSARVTPPSLPLTKGRR